MEKEQIEFKLLVSGKDIFQISFNGSSLDYLNQIISKSDEITVYPIHASLLKMAKKKRIHNKMAYTNEELKKAFGFPSKGKKLRKFVFESSNERLEFNTRMEALEKLKISANRVADAIKNGGIVIEGVKYDFKRE